ncbi:helix-turn-helix domain-containing protein [Natrarchaeobaculum aegyptiacum]|uniref:Bacterio-opsin activator n=1 Tax=Natrarchaeobaculum aegyptiacum TaxID=745377 RepID=A0A2Z2HYH5_9EURY|nr:helix-turn-helix domain-containing protein [Natrarchaeobaculum aegyptiacum]ARS88588.1 bacterio-opsin activator [Natrarchaeobaculum aegyptiacum]
MRFVEVIVEEDDADRSSFDRQVAETDAILREELLNWRLSRNEVLNQLLFVLGDRRAYETALEAAPEIREYELRPVDDGRFYAYVQESMPNAETSWWAAFLAHDFIHVPPVVFEDGVVRLTLLGEFDALREVVADLSAEVRIEIEEIGDYRGPGPRITDRLTARQYRALRVALERGYYEIPREAQLAEVAAELECTESTASDLLRRAERELVRAVLSP